jgi:plastocyanin
MRTQWNRLALTIALAGLAVLGCGGDSNNPSDGGTDGGGGPVGTVVVGNTFFQSGHNGTKDPAVDTIAVNATVTWTWTSTGATSHSVRSQGDPSFTSSDIQAGNGTTHTATFTAAGTYQYDCAVHGSAMTGRIVVQ